MDRYSTRARRIGVKERLSPRSRSRTRKTHHEEHEEHEGDIPIEIQIAIAIAIGLFLHRSGKEIAPRRQGSKGGNKKNREKKQTR